MTQGQRATLAQREAQSLVSRLRDSNKRAARKGAPSVEEGQYQDLEKLLARKLLRRRS